MNNPYISNVHISRNNQEFSRGDSWFSVTWFEQAEQHHTIPRSVNLRFEPGRQACASYAAEDDGVQLPPPHIPRQQMRSVDSDSRDSMSESSGSSMDVDPPKEMAEWTAAVGDLFEQAAGIVNEEAKDKLSPEIPVLSLQEEPSKALWPLNMWNSIKAIIWGEQLSTSKNLYRIGLP